MEDPGLPGSTPCGRAFPGSIDGKKGMKTQRDDTSVRSFYFNANALIPVVYRDLWNFPFLGGIKLFILFDSILDGSCLKFST